MLCRHSICVAQLSSSQVFGISTDVVRDRKLMSYVNHNRDGKKAMLNVHGENIVDHLYKEVPILPYYIPLPQPHNFRNTSKQHSESPESPHISGTAGEIPSATGDIPHTEGALRSTRRRRAEKGASSHCQRSISNS